MTAAESVQKRMKEMMMDEKLCDVTFVVGEVM